MGRFGKGNVSSFREAIFNAGPNEGSEFGGQDTIR